MEVATLELEREFVDELYADGEGVAAFYVDGDGVVVSIAETAAEFAIGGDGSLVPQHGNVCYYGHKEQ
jgi:hypothetical protein